MGFEIGFVFNINIDFMCLVVSQALHQITNLTHSGFRTGHMNPRHHDGYFTGSVGC